MKNIILSGLFIVFLSLNYSSVLFAFEVNIDPNIETISSSQFLWQDENGGVRFRVVVVLSEVYLNVFIQKIEFGKENCCAKIIKTYEIDGEKLEGKYQLFSVTDIRWLNGDTLEFKGNSTVYRIKNLDGAYEVQKIKGKKKRKDK